jgi:hypothetical protein
MVKNLSFNVYLQFLFNWMTLVYIYSMWLFRVIYFWKFYYTEILDKKRPKWMTRWIGDKIIFDIITIVIYDFFLNEQNKPLQRLIYWGLYSHRNFYLILLFAKKTKIFAKHLIFLFFQNVIYWIFCKDNCYNTWIYIWPLNTHWKFI